MKILYIIGCIVNLVLIIAGLRSRITRHKESNVSLVLKSSLTVLGSWLTLVIVLIREKRKW